MNCKFGGGCLILLLSLALSVLAVDFPDGFRVTMSTACQHIVVPTGTSVSGGDGEHGGDLHLQFPNGSLAVVPPCWTEQELIALQAMHKRVASERIPHPMNRTISGPNQWLAWFLADFPVWQDGGTALTADWVVPSLPQKPGSNFALFPGVQPTYDPKPYDFILVRVV